MTYPEMLGYVRERWGRANLPRNGSIVKQLWKRYGPNEVEVMVKGAALLGWQDLRGLWSKEGIGRRWATQKYWESQNRNRKLAGRELEAVAAVLKAKGF